MDMDEIELVLEAASFTGPERREVQQRFDTPFGDLLSFTLEAMQSGRGRIAPLVDSRDGVHYFPDEVLQFMVWVQARRANPAASLEDFDHLTLRDLNDARARGIKGKATGPETSTSSSPGSDSAGSSPA